MQSISLYTHDLKKTLSEEVINRIIEEFKCTGKYDEEDSEEEIKYYALYEYAKKNFDKLSQEEKDGYKTLITDKNDKFMMVEYNGETVIGELVRNILYKGKKEVLYEKGKKGLYDEFLPIISSKSFAISEEKQQLFKMKEQLQNYNNRPLNQEIGYDGDKTCKKPIR